MKSLDFGRFVLGGSVAAAMLAGCEHLSRLEGSRRAAGAA